MADNTFLGTFVTQYARLMLPLKEALQTESNFRALFLDLGWAIPSPPVTEAQTVVNAIESLIDNLDNLPTSPTELDIITVLADVSEVYSSVKNFTTAIANSTSGIAPFQNVFIAEFPGDLFNYMICKYLNETSKIVFNGLLSLNIVEYFPIEKNDPRPSYIKIRINYAKMGTLISNPDDLVKTAFR